MYEISCDETSFWGFIFWPRQCATALFLLKHNEVSTQLLQLPFLFLRADSSCMKFLCDESKLLGLHLLTYAMRNCSFYDMVCAVCPFRTLIGFLQKHNGIPSQMLQWPFLCASVGVF